MGNSKVVKADHSILKTAYNPKGLPLGDGPNGTAPSFKFENQVASKRYDCRKYMNQGPTTLEKDDDKENKNEDLYAGPSMFSDIKGARPVRHSVTNPSYSVPKDTNQSMLKVIEKHG